MPVEFEQEIRVLHVDDDPSITDLTAMCLEREDDQLSVETAVSAGEGLQRINDDQPDCVVSDYNMPGMDGLEFLQNVRDKHPDLPFILFTGKGSEAVASDAISTGVTDYLQKQSGTEQYELLANRIQNAVSARRSAAAVKKRRHQFEQILKTVPGCVVQVDADGQFTFANDRAEEVLGLEKYKVTERTYNDPRWDIKNSYGDPVPDRELPFKQIRETGEPVYDERIDIQWPDGTRKLLSVNGAPVFDEDGEFESAVFSLADLTDREERQQELRRLRESIDKANVPITLADPSQEGNPLVYVNDAFEDITGYPPEETLGHNCRFLQGVDTDPEKVTTLREAIDNEEAISVVLRNYRKDGTEFWNRLSITPIYDDDGELVRYLGTQQDVTERKEREQQLTQLNQATQALMMAEAKQEVADIGVEAASDILDFNANAIHFSEAGDTKLVPVAHTGKVTKIAGDTTVLPVADSIAGRVYQDGEPEALENVQQDPDAYDPGTNLSSYLYLPLADHGMLIAGAEEQGAFDQQDVMLGELLAENLVAALDRVRRKQDLQRIKNQYQTLVENFPDGAVFLYDSDLTYVRARGEELRKVGLSPDDVIGKKPHDLFPEETADEICNYLQKALEGEGNTFEHEYGGERYRLRAVPVQTDPEETDYVMGVSQNITEYAENRQSLEHKNKRLEEFASIISHDLRNPLRVADGRLELIREECESDHIDYFAQSLDRMDALIGDLLTLAREGKQIDEIGSAELANVVKNSWQTVSTKQAALEINTTCTIKADRDRLRQLFENLHRNAIEHGGEDVTVSIGMIDGGFYVADTGPGIPEADREEVFNSGYSTSEDGTGFGLRIVEQIIDGHDWDITVTESQQGGARFEITGVQQVD